MAIVLLLAGVVCLFVPQVPRVAGVVAIIVGVAIGIASAVVIVPAGHVGVPILFGKVQQFHLAEGLHLVNPLLVVEKMSVRTEFYTMSVVSGEGQVQGDDSIMVLSSDGLQMPLDVTVAYRLVPEDAPWVYKNIGISYAAKLIRPASRTAIREAASTFTAQEAYSIKRQELAESTQQLLEKRLKDLLSKYEDFTGEGVLIQQVMLRNVALPTRVRRAIEEKLSAEQDAQRMEFVLAKETKEAERKRIEAGGIADFQKIVSEGISDKLLQWKGIDATLEISKSNNAKVVIIGSGDNGLPVILNADKD